MEMVTDTCHTLYPGTSGSNTQSIVGGCRRDVNGVGVGQFPRGEIRLGRTGEREGRRGKA